MRKLLRSAIRIGMRKGLRSGVLDGNRAWIVVGGAALLAHLGRRAIGGEADVVFSEVLAPGEAFVIRHLTR